MNEIAAYFAGGHVVKLPREGYDESLTIPKAERGVVAQAVGGAVKAGHIWLIAGNASVLGELVPADLLGDDAVLQAPPTALGATDVLREKLPDAWMEETATAIAIAHALSAKVGKPLPWPLIKDAIDSAIRSRLLELASDSSPWPCDAAGAAGVRLIPQAAGAHRSSTRYPSEPPRSPRPIVPGVRVAEGEVPLNEIEELAARLIDVRRATAGYDMTVRVRIEIGGKPVSDDLAAKVNEILADVTDRLKLQ